MGWGGGGGAGVEAGLLEGGARGGAGAAGGRGQGRPRVPASASVSRPVPAHPGYSFPTSRRAPPISAWTLAVAFVLLSQPPASTQGAALSLVPAGPAQNLFPDVRG